MTHVDGFAVDHAAKGREIRMGHDGLRCGQRRRHRRPLNDIGPEPVIVAGEVSADQCAAVAQDFFGPSGGIDECHIVRTVDQPKTDDFQNGFGCLGA